MLVLVASHLELSPAFTGAPHALRLVKRSRAGKGPTAPTCLFGMTPTNQGSKTEILVPVTQAEDPKPYGQRMYPVHPDDLSSADRRNGLLKMILAVGVRDLAMGMITAFAFIAADSNFASPDYHFPYAVWLLSCIFARLVTQDDMAPVSFDMKLGPLPQAKAAIPVIRRADSFAQWRDSTINPNIASQTPRRVGAATARQPRPQLNKGTQRLVVNFAATARPAEEPSVPVPMGLKMLGTIIMGFIADLTGSIWWMLKIKGKAQDEPEPETWDPREPTSPESGV